MTDDNKPKAVKRHIIWNNEEIPEHLRKTLEDLIDYFEISSGDWPMTRVITEGFAYTGLISDELYDILREIYECLEDYD